MRFLAVLLLLAPPYVLAEPANGRIFNPKEILTTAIEITINPTREMGAISFPPGSPVRVIKDAGTTKVVILIGETREQAIVPRAAIAEAGETPPAPVKVMSIQPPASISTARADGPDGVWTGIATGDEVIPSSNSSFEKQVLVLTNAERTKRGLAPLIWDDELARAARYHAADMYVQDYGGHLTKDAIIRKGQSPGEFPQEDIKSRVLRFLRKPRFPIGENIHARRNDAKPADIVAAWMASPGHRANILTPEYRKLGVGFITSKNGRMDWGYSVQCFSG